MNTHICELFLGMTVAGKRKVTAGRCGHPSPKFVHQNALHHTIALLRVFTSSLMAWASSAGAAISLAAANRMDAYGPALLWCAAHFGSFGSAPCPIASRRFTGLELARSKVWSNDHLLDVASKG